MITDNTINKRPLKELLILFRPYVKENLVYGMCDLVITCQKPFGRIRKIPGLTSAEIYRIKVYLYDSSPELTITHDGNIALNCDHFWWTMGKVKPRLKWLDEQIKKL